MAPVPRYGSISSTDEEVELPTPHHDQEYIGVIDAASPTISSPTPDKSSTTSKWTRHHCASYAITALVCLFSARYWHGRAVGGSLDDNGILDDGSKGFVVATSGSRVPTPPALSDLDPAADLGFRVTTRKGLALPSKAWGERYLNSGEDGGFTPLPTNEWYLNLLSHKAANDPSNSGEVAHVYTIPYVVGVSPPNPPEKKGSGGGDSVMAGIELLLPAMKTADRNMQMVFDRHNGVSLGAIVEKGNDETEKSTSLTSYTVDPDEPLSPLGVSLKWNHVDMKSSIVRGMPYGTMRYGKQKRNGKASHVLPMIASGNRAVSILIDSVEGSEDKQQKMECGSITGKPITQDAYAHRTAPLTTDGKPKAYTVQREVIFHLDQSDFTWVAFFSRPVKVECRTDAVAAVSVPGPKGDVQFTLDVLEVLDADDDNDDDEEELVVRIAILNECTTGNAQIKEHCEHLVELGYKTISDKEKSDEYLQVLREGSMVFPKSPAVGTQFPTEEDDDEEGEGGSEGRATDVVFDWDATSVVASKSVRDADATAAASPAAVAASSLRAATSVVDDATGVAPTSVKDEKGALITFALPHHLESLMSTEVGDVTPTTLCVRTFHGRTCLVRGSTWNMRIPHGEPQSFLADRPPAAEAIPALSDALVQDMKFQLSGNVLRGAADTYFPAKILAKLGRVIEINEELASLKSMASGIIYPDADDAAIEKSASAAASVSLPSNEDVESLLDDLQTAVEIWLKPGGKAKGGAEAEFIYDESWGGFVNCGCKYIFKKGHGGDGTCNNTFPECPALADVNEDFGNGWYNDHHFHYGYHIYAASVVAKHRPEWAREYYERILLYIRDVANPSPDDTYFPVFRQKDWYLGNSWAAGLMSMELSPHGREQESSSEAIAAFEGIALYGNVMMQVFADEKEKIESARLVRNVGELLTAMEVSAANRFWHIWGSKYDEEGSTTLESSANDSNTEKKSPHINTYPKKYTKPVVGMMHETMASFQTWFAPEDVVSYGIQLIPLTAVAERRDDPEWSSILYPVYAESCEDADQANNGFCQENGWSIVQAGLLAEMGEIEEALEMATAIPEDVFVSQGACGNSLSNTLWFISTRKQSALNG